MATRSQIDRIPKGLHHLELTAKSKFAYRYPTRAPHPPTAFVQPRDRVVRWNVVPGDKVRLMVGKPHEKYLNEEMGKRGGWKVYTVNSVDMERNRVYLNGLTNKKSNPPRALPEDFDTLPEETKKEWLEQPNFIKTQRPVQYSNVQLCVEDAGPDSVFATRLGTSEPVFDRGTKRWAWRRFAAKLSGASTVPPDAESGRVSIPWPKPESRKVESPSPHDTLEDEVRASTLKLGRNATAIPASLVPASMRAPPPADQAWADEYIFNPASRGDKRMQAAMPLYLGEELGPRFARAKKQKGWQERRGAESGAREIVATGAVEEWEITGRDAGLEDTLKLDIVGLEGVKIRPRTRAEVRDATRAEFDAEVASSRRAAAHAAAAGQVFDTEDGVWYEGPKGVEAERKRARKARKQRKITERLENLTLREEKNQVVPKELRQE